MKQRKENEMMQRKFVWPVALAIGLIAAMVVTATAVAQYPPATGSVIIGADETTPDLGEEVVVTATIVDEDGTPIAGAECTFSVADQPGDSASVAAGPFTTDADGNV